MWRRLLPAALAAALLAPAAAAENVDLVTLPARADVQLTIYNSEDLTQVKEIRSVALKRGANSLQFSWTGTLIDPTSLRFRPLEHADEIEIADSVIPGRKPQHLIWHVQSAFEGQVPVEISYFTSGLTWSMDYVCTVGPDEQRMDFRGFVRVLNQSGEEYENARVRLVVGNINLVEKIAELARRYGLPPPAPGAAPADELRRDAMTRALEAAENEERKLKEDAAAGAAPSKAPVTRAPKGIVKEGLSEYFLFSIDGTETIKNGWSKRMRAVKAEDAGFEIVYRLREHQYGPRPVRFFVWKNDAEHKLGESPLPDGRVRVFRENGSGGLAFLGQQQVRYAPIKAEIEVNLGPDDLVVYERRPVGVRRFDFTYDDKDRVDGWTEEARWLDTVRNYRGRPIRLELQRIWAGDVEYDSEPKAKLFDYRTIEVAFEVAARGREEYPQTVTRRQGKSTGQARIRLR